MPQETNLTDEMLQRLKEKGALEHKRFYQDMTALGESDKRLALGADALLYLNDSFENGEGLIEFIKWVVHPRSGFLPQTLRAKPMSDDLREVLEDTVALCNEDVDTVNIDKKKRTLLRTSFAEISIEPNKKAAFFQQPEFADAKIPHTIGILFKVGKLPKPEDQKRHVEEARSRAESSTTRYITLDDLTKAMAQALEAYLAPEKVKANPRQM